MSTVPVPVAVLANVIETRGLTRAASLTTATAQLHALAAAGLIVLPAEPTEEMTAAATGGPVNRKDLSGIRRVFLTCWRRAASYSRRVGP